MAVARAKKIPWDARRVTGDKASRDWALSVFKARAGKAREFCMDFSLPVGLPVRLAENDLRVPVEDIPSAGCLPPPAGLTRIGENQAAPGELP